MLFHLRFCWGNLCALPLGFAYWRHAGVFGAQADSAGQAEQSSMAAIRRAEDTPAGALASIAARTMSVGQVLFRTAPKFQLLRLAATLVRKLSWLLLGRSARYMKALSTGVIPPMDQMEYYLHFSLGTAPKHIGGIMVIS